MAEKSSAKRARSQEEGEESDQQKRRKVNNDDSSSGSDEENDEANDLKVGTFVAVNLPNGFRFAKIKKANRVTPIVKLLKFTSEIFNKGSYYSLQKTDKKIARADVIKEIEVSFDEHESKFFVANEVITEISRLTNPTQTPGPLQNLDVAEDNKQSTDFDLDFSRPKQKKKASLLPEGFSVKTSDQIGLAHQDVWKGANNSERLGYLLRWLNYNKYFTSSAANSAISKQGKTPTPSYLYFKLLYYVIPQDETKDEQIEGAVKTSIVTAFNGEANPDKYKIYGKKYFLTSLIQDYLEMSENTWTTAVCQLINKGAVWLKETVRTDDNFMYVIIPPLVPNNKK